MLIEIDALTLVDESNEEVALQCKQVRKINIVVTHKAGSAMAPLLFLINR